MPGATQPLQVCLIPRLEGLGGPASFQARLVRGLAANGVQVSYHPEDTALSCILVIGGTSNLAALWRARRRGVRIIQRLNGMNWIHRRRWTGARHFLRSEINNTLLALIRAYLADTIIYQSQFSQDWWERVHGHLAKSCQTIYNGVDLAEFSPEGPGAPPADRIRVQMVEGRLGGGHEAGLRNGVALVESLIHDHRVPAELVIVGQVPEMLQREAAQRLGDRVTFLGAVPRERIPELNRSAHLFFSADLNAACPNAVIEALACGLPVLAFDTGALKELVPAAAGRVVPYGANLWRLEPPDIPALARAASEILPNLEAFRQGARQQAVDRLGLDRMVAAYLAVFQ